MALFHSNFFSETLGMQCQAHVILPQPASELQIGVSSAPKRERWPCLWLLHGLSDDHSIWCRNTSIERYANEAGVAVVMPNAHRSFYVNMKQGEAFGSYLHEELPRLMRSFFPLSDRKEDNAVAGLSMGGYGASRWLLTKPEAFQAGVSLSGVLDISSRHQRAMDNPDEALRHDTMLRCFGEEPIAGTQVDLFHLLDKADSPSAPPLLQICGTEDFLYEDNLRFRDHAQACKYPLSYEERSGAHDWAFWDREIQVALGWLKQQGFANSLS